MPHEPGKDPRRPKNLGKTHTRTRTTHKNRGGRLDGYHGERRRRLETLLPNTRSRHQLPIHTRQNQGDQTMTIAETSLQAFKQKLEDGSLSQDQETIYKLVDKEGPITCTTAAKMLRRTPNQISGRFTELLDKNLIQITGHQDGHRLYEVKN